MDDRRQEWERRTGWALTTAALAYLAAYAVPLVWPAVPGWARHLADATIAVTWAVLVIDYVVRVVLARRRWRFVLRNLPDLVVIALPMLRSLRLVRLLALVRVLDRNAAATLRGRVAVYVAGAAALLLFCASLAVLDVERGARGSNIVTFPDAVWWSITTMSTVGYGDHYPVTTAGRIVAVLLMLGGIGLLGVVTATVTDWLVSHVRVAQQQIADRQAVELRELREHVTRLERLVEQRLPAPAPAPWAPAAPPEAQGHERA